MRIADDLLLDDVTAFGIAIGDLEAQSIGIDQFNLTDRVTALVVKKRLLIADQILQVSNLRSIDRGIVSFGVHSISDRVPETAGDGISGAYAILGASRPTRFDPRTARGWILADQVTSPLT